MKILVLGAGKMVEAILSGLACTESLSDWGIYSPSGISASELAKKTGAQFVSDLNSIQDPDWILVGCKPQQLNSLKELLNGRFQRPLYISLLAAVSEDSQKKILGVERLIRAMPNLSVKFREGVTLLSSTSAPQEMVETQKLFANLGIAQIMSEESLEELTLLTGSGPALFYEFTLNLSQNFISLSQKDRETLARQVLLGSAMSTKNETLPLESMIDNVTSKGGVTIAVLTEWRARGLTALLKKGIEAGKLRTEEIKNSFKVIR